jgi:excinuclease ABC subunit A
MGPEGGNRGGYVVAEGTPEQVAAHPDSYTGQFLKPLLADTPARQPSTKRAPRKAPAAKQATTTKKAPAKRVTTKAAARRSA